MFWRLVSNRSGFALALFALAAACTTYHAAGPTGGFTEIKLSDTSYQVQFRGNGYTGPARVQQFVLRRSAELALENGFRYFTTDAPQNLDRNDFWQQYRERGVTIRFADKASAETLDALVVVESTNEAAGGQLSEKARAQLQKFKEQS